MAGNKAGGQKAARTNLARDPDFYRKIGTLGGTKSRGGGFAANRELASTAGRIGGTISRRGKAKKTQLDEYRMDDLQDVPPPPKKKRGWGSIFHK